MQSRDTTNLNLDKDLEEILSKTMQVGGSEKDKTRRLWAQDEGEDSENRSPDFQSKTDSIVQRVVSIKAREKEYEEILSDLDKVWKEVSEEWQKYLMVKEESPAL